MKKDDLGMRTEEERIELIHRRTAEIKEENRKKSLYACDHRSWNHDAWIDAKCSHYHNSCS